MKSTAGVVAGMACLCAVALGTAYSLRTAINDSRPAASASRPMAEPHPRPVVMTVAHDDSASPKPIDGCGGGLMVPVAEAEVSQDAASVEQAIYTE